MIDKDNLKLLRKAKTRLGSAIKRLNQAGDLLSEYRQAIPPEQRDKSVIGTVPPEYYMLFDLRRNVRGVRQQLQRQLWTLHLIHFLERRKCQQDS